MLSPAADTCSCLDYYNEVLGMDCWSYCCVPASICKRTQLCWRETSRSVCFATGTISESVVTWEVSLFRRMFNLPQLPNRNVVFWVQQNSYYETEMEAHTPHVMIRRGATDSRDIGPYFFERTLRSRGILLY